MSAKLLRSLFIEESPHIKCSDRLAAKLNNVTFKIPNFSTTLFEHLFIVAVIRLRRELPTKMKNSLSLETFKIKAFNFFLMLIKTIYFTCNRIPSSKISNLKRFDGVLVLEMYESSVTFSFNTRFWLLDICPRCCGTRLLHLTSYRAVVNN
ncbi:Protein of unknown function [Cotesia congregata]|uniref:Uncharacterized protein n=1 Tax=Cotesia congregata TaxID=51543 RepID=A0A8J2H6A8_COTCN|nr:Protein of unknown function [Cotesia congregata]